MKTLNNETPWNDRELIRVKSDNYDCWFTKEAYYYLTLIMSSGDYGSHKAYRIFGDESTLERCKGKFPVVECCWDDEVNDYTGGFWFWCDYDAWHTDSL